MKHRWDFFKESDSSFGLFYPHNYTMLAFDTTERAEEAGRAFVAAGFAEEDVAAASGTFVVEQVESQEKANWLDRLREQIARIVGTEAGYIDDDLKHARKGGAFLFVYTPDDTTIARMHDIVPTLHPLYARRYLTAGIEQITYPPQSVI